MFIWSNCSLSIAHGESNGKLTTNIRHLKQVHVKAIPSNMNDVSKCKD